jgi:hypothetical protein
VAMSGYAPPVKRLASLLLNYHKNGGTGLLHMAMKLWANELGKSSHSILIDQGINIEANLYQDAKALEWRGFPPLFKESGYITPKLRVDEETCELIIMAAATIILLSDLEGTRVGMAVSPADASRRPFQSFTAALVLRGVDLLGVASGSKLSLDEVEKLLEKAIYFSCSFENNMLRTLNELNLVEQAVDRESEQQVLVPITFQHTQDLPLGGFGNKLQLLQYLRKARGFAVGTLRGLLTIGGLGKSGFIRV